MSLQTKGTSNFRLEDQAKAEALARQATVAVVTALPIEQAAMEAMLDEPLPLSTAGNAPGEFLVGKIPSKDGAYHVVILARCDIAENLAATNATILFERFPQLDRVLVVGIAGAAPDPTKPENDVHLGDIVVSNEVGVIQYDYEKEILRGEAEVIHESRHPPRPPSARLLAAAKDLEVQDLKGESRWEANTARARLPWTDRPRFPDELHAVDNPPEILLRSVDPRRRPSSPRVIFGPIASANKLLKNARVRERLRKSLGVKAVEMEAAGVADAAWAQGAGFFIIRGICDYCDEFKADYWQGYAALIAAAYARALLEATRASANAAHRSRKSADYPILASLPEKARKSLDALAEQVERGEDIVAGLAELVEIEQALPTHVDMSWPRKVPWALSVVATVPDFLGTAKLLPGETLACLTLPFVSSAIQKLWSTERLRQDASKDTFANAIHEILQTTPDLDRLFSDTLPEQGKEVVRQWGLQRWLHELQRVSSDIAFQGTLPDTRIARSFLANTHVPTALRAIAGDMTQFDALPDSSVLRIGQIRLDVRWKLVACIIALAEASVPSIRLLTPDVVEHLSLLPDVWASVESNFDDITLVRKSDQWILRAVCNEPVMDFAINAIASQLDTDLRSHRARMSNYLAQITEQNFPTVNGDPQAAHTNGKPRYTTPHVVFSLSAEHARRLFMGTNLWKDPSLAYRELFQNALDACRYRAARCQYLDIPYTPQITLYQGIDEDGQEYVECQDNGVGMDRFIIESCFSIAGRRFIDTDEYRRERREWEKKNISSNTNSKFGIGVFSYFLVANDLEIETSRLSPDGAVLSSRLLLRVPSASSFFRIVEITDAEARKAQLQRLRDRGWPASGALDAGTRVRLRLPRRSAKTERDTAVLTCVEALREHVWFSEVHVVASHYKGDSYEILPNHLALQISAVAVVGSRHSFWWISKSDVRYAQNLFLQEHDLRVLETYRSRSSACYQYPGRVLVDGIATNLATPGFIINLTGEDTPSLSLDRLTVESDISDVVLECVAQSLGSLPATVPDRLLSDFWHFDPRVCHAVNSSISSGDRRVDPFAFGSDTARLKEYELQYARRAFFPAESPGEAPSKATKLQQLWEIARKMPDARQLDAFVLEDRHVTYEFRRHLRNIPDVLWDAWQHIELGVPESAALEYGGRRATSEALPFYMSWLSGLSPKECQRLLIRLVELFDLRWVLPSRNAVDCSAVTDYESWLLGHGKRTRPWLGPDVETLDVVLFSEHSGQSLSDSVREYQSMAARLGFPFHWHEELASKLGQLSDDERSFAVAFRSGWHNRSLASLTHERILLIAAATRQQPPSKKENPVDKLFGSESRLGNTEAENLVIRRIRSAIHAPDYRVDLAVLCQVAATLGKEKQIAEVAERIRSAVQIFGHDVSYGEDGLSVASGLDDADWILIRDRPAHALVIPGRVGIMTRQRLAARISSNSYYFYKHDGQYWHRRLSELYALFGWGEPPLTVHDVEKALNLPREAAVLAEQASNDGVLAIGPLISVTATNDIPLHAMNAAFECLTPLGFRGPTEDDTYIGISWKEMSHHT